MLVIEGREVRVTHPDKPYFPRQTKLSKLDLARYYLSIAPGALAGIRDRPLVLKRFVNGTEGEAFYQKRAPAGRPSWLRTGLSGALRKEAMSYDGAIMMSRTQVTLEPEIQRRAKQRAHDLGLSLAEYVRRLLMRDLGQPPQNASPAAVFDLGASGDSDMARNKDRMLGEAFGARPRRGRRLR